MSNYVKSTSFSSKDSLPTGDPLKIVKGTEIDTEFNNIATAVASKADTNSPTFTGTPVAPTATFGTSNTTLATTAFVQAALQAVYPVGSIYISTLATNPGTTFGFGTWSEFGAGRVLVGQNTSDTSFDVLEETGGSKDAIVVEHTHTFSATTGSSGDHQHAVDYPLDCTSNRYAFGSTTVSGVSTDAFCDTGGSSADIPLTQTAGAHTHTVSGTTSSTGSSGTNANLQPYVVVKMWKRTA